MDQWKWFKNQEAEPVREKLEGERKMEDKAEEWEGEER